MPCLNFQNTYFKKYLLTAAFIRFKFTSFSEHIKVDALFIKQRSYFFSEYFDLNNHPNNTYLHSHFHEERGFDQCCSSCFFHYFLRRHSLKTFFYWRNKDFHFFQATLSTLNILYIRTYLHQKAHLGLHSNNEIAALKTQIILISLLKNLILQNCLHRLNIWECGYYTKTE